MKINESILYADGRQFIQDIDDILTMNLVLKTKFVLVYICCMLLFVVEYFIHAHSTGDWIITDVTLLPKKD